MTEYEENLDELKNLNWTDEERHALQLELDSTYEAKKHLWELRYGFDATFTSSIVTNVPSTSTTTSTPPSTMVNNSLLPTVGPSQISRPGAPGRGDVRQHVTFSFWMPCSYARACQHGLPCVKVMMRFG
ncbi:unnamed protein product [Prunus armeniaca]